MSDEVVWYVYEVKPEHRRGRARFWRPASSGYTDEITGAGLYTKPQEGETFRSVPLSELREEIAREYDRALERVEDLKAMLNLADREPCVECGAIGRRLHGGSCGPCMAGDEPDRNHVPVTGAPESPAAISDDSGEAPGQNVPDGREGGEDAR